MPHMLEAMKQLAVHFFFFSFNLSFLSYQEKVAFLDHYSIKIIPTYYKVLLS